VWERCVQEAPPVRSSCEAISFCGILLCEVQEVQAV